ncbi:adenylate/guanylate cyclase domain-containing protein [Motiliproteus sp. SC1-56]|uniref:adenylate/guanylate cyclase domain-containing protein n=1 Tax=Motiliproteus sp. SC1-56 TaxID=2799565 RepID=UPI001A8FF14D|nr:adenylate/guanylate cyclase domain-containing protein [Motiliproteus sp. SC1-56]
MDRKTSDSQATFLEAERSGIKLAIKGRLIAIAALGTWYLFTRSDRVAEVAFAAGLLALLGGLHYALVQSRHDRPWIKYAFVTVDILLLTAAILLTPEAAALGLPKIIVFHYDVFPLYFVILAVAAFSFSPGLVVWAGIGGALAWLAAFGWVANNMDVRLEWTDVPRTESAQAYLEVMLSPHFAGTGSRLQESLILVTVAVLLAIVMQRARRTVHRHLEADARNRLITDVFGRYVPSAVADLVISDHGSLAPTERVATVLFIDIAGFTRLTERLGPARVVEVLNAYFDAVARIIAAHHGVVTQFQGDAVLATFNVPLTDDQHAHKAVSCAQAIISAVHNQRFGGESLSVRIGVTTGPLIAGNVGGGGRQSYTVHGNTVNMAARLEAMNKELGTSLLVSESTAKAIGTERLKMIATAEIRGLKGRRPVYTLLPN